ncbi:Peptidase S24/S26A/S26B, conserved region [Allomuricauda ruestringensis DSM 13258]|uniref:Peptidase S24/S26A/S26B, conserved region n=1 Tax=Allomuricauda ruestringensis (strain DSM 13258 / CIP 107369 / LMG 19739 / B1) TaxID=886377 RepID=G2PIW4_ALLRU|nr:translesion error-prone DNA polymerase V autoproteolytic subunit [Allomuricauda ruestringensis]AEM70763.1 Peptidase S24/S26A/S26B, conserved region [Allomuricauda ruestringensis DSM 13258]
MIPKKSQNTDALTFFVPDKEQNVTIPISNNTVSAGFPSPADDFKQKRISLDNTLIKNKEATFYARVSGQSMIGAGLDDGDLLVIDRSLEAEHGKIAVCFLDGEFTVKRLSIEKDTITLMPENKNYKPIKVSKDSDLLIWGVVTYVIKAV